MIEDFEKEREEREEYRRGRNQDKVS